MIEFNPQINLNTSPINKGKINTNKNYLPSYLLRQGEQTDTVSFSSSSGKKKAVKASAAALAASALLTGCSAKSINPDYYIKNNILPAMTTIANSIPAELVSTPKEPTQEESEKYNQLKKIVPEQTEQQYNQITSELVSEPMMKYAPPPIEEEVIPEPIPAPEPEPMVKYAPPPIDVVIPEPVPEPIPAPEPGPLPKYAPPPIEEEVIPEPVPEPVPEPMVKYAPPPIEEYTPEPEPEPLPMPKYAPPPIEEPVPEPIPESEPVPEPTVQEKTIPENSEPDIEAAYEDNTGIDEIIADNNSEIQE